jgi:hypothetical protein
MKPTTLRLTLLVYFFISAFFAMGQNIDNYPKLKQYSVFATGGVIDNNSLPMYGNIASGVPISGSNFAMDSTISGSDPEYIATATFYAEFVDSLRLRSTSIISQLGANIYPGNYEFIQGYTHVGSDPVRLIGDENDEFFFKVDGDLNLSSITNIVLEGVRSENVFWLVEGNVTIAQNAWVYGSFFVNENIVVDDDVKGAFAIFANGTATIQKTNAISSMAWRSYSPFQLPPLFCDDRCILQQMVVNGNFSNPPICTTATNLNGFMTDLIYSVGIFFDSCWNPPSRQGFYKIDKQLYSWNAYCDPMVIEHTGNEQNMLFVDGFQHSDGAFPPYVRDTNVNLIWGQQIPDIQPGVDYLFSFWSANTNHRQLDTDVPLRILFNGVELPNTRYSIPGNTGATQWAQHCVKWTAPGTIGGPLTSVLIEVRQLGPFSISGRGQDFVMDDFSFGIRGESTIQIGSSFTTNYCQGANTTLYVIDPKPNSVYQWFLNGNIISGATGSTYVATQVGLYSVQGMDANGCLLTSNSINVTLQPLVGQFISHTVSTSTSNPVWTPGTGNNPFASVNGTVWIKNLLVIPTGVNLTIRGMRFEFGNNARVIVQAGAKLILESLNGTPTVFTAYNCPNTMWQGVQLQSSGNSRGILEMKAESTIEHARIGVDNRSINPKSKVLAQGYVIANGAIFQNNYVAVLLNSKNSNTDGNSPQNNRSTFTACKFRTTANMRDQIRYPGGIHKVFVDLAYISNVKFIGNEFINTVHTAQPAAVNNVFDEAKVTTNKGITSLYSSFLIEDENSPNVFTNLWVGIDYVQSARNYVRQKFANCDFGSTAYGIILRASNGAQIEGCQFFINPQYSLATKAVPKSFIGINARGSRNFTITENLFTEGYCGVLVANEGAGSSLIYKNTFIGVGKRSKGRGQGVYTWGSNNVQIACNTFVSGATDLVQNHMVSNGTLKEQGACRSNQKPNQKPANNRFEGSPPFNADVYAMQEESGFLYYVENILEPIITPLYKEGSTNMTNVYVQDCRGLYIDETACPSLLIDDFRPIAEIRDSLDYAIQFNDEEKIQSFLLEALAYYDLEDSTGLQSIRLLNETPHITAKWMLASRYLAREAYAEAILALQLLPSGTMEEQEEKSFYEFLIQLEVDSISLTDSSNAFVGTLQNWSASSTATAEEVRGILHYLNGDGYSIPLPFEEGSEAPINLNEAEGTKSEKDLKIYPNPTEEEFSLVLPKDFVIQKVEIANLQGKVIEQYVSIKSLNYETKNLASGTYFVIITNTINERFVKKLIVNR